MTSCSGGRTAAYATREKALLDLLYLYPFYGTETDVANPRLDQDTLQADVDGETLAAFAARFGSRALERRVRLLRAIDASLQSVDLDRKRKDFEHLLFHPDNSRRILRFRMLCPSGLFVAIMNLPALPHPLSLALPLTYGADGALPLWLSLRSIARRRTV